MSIIRSFAAVEVFRASAVAALSALTCMGCTQPQSGNVVNTWCEPKGGMVDDFEDKDNLPCPAFPGAWSITASDPAQVTILDPVAPLPAPPPGLEENPDGGGTDGGGSNTSARAMHLHAQFSGTKGWVALELTFAGNQDLRPFNRLKYRAYWKQDMGATEIGLRDNGNFTCDGCMGVGRPADEPSSFQPSGWYDRTISFAAGPDMLSENMHDVLGQTRSLQIRIVNTDNQILVPFELWIDDVRLEP